MAGDTVAFLVGIADSLYIMPSLFPSLEGVATTFATVEVGRWGDTVSVAGSLAGRTMRGPVCQTLTQLTPAEGVGTPYVPFCEPWTMSLWDGYISTT